MKRLVLLGEGEGDVLALLILLRKILRDKGLGNDFFADKDVLRIPPTKLIRWDRQKGESNFDEWNSTVTSAANWKDIGGVLAVYDGDLPHFPAGSGTEFCARTAARAMANSARKVGAGSRFSLSVVFALTEYETWLVAGVESLAGRQLPGGRFAAPRNVRFPSGDPESHGKRWLQENISGYRPTRDQGPLTELLDLETVRSKNLRSFRRLEHAVEQLAEAAVTGNHISTPD